MRSELVVKSRSLAGNTDLTLLAPIKPGLVPSMEAVTYKTRVKRLLEALSVGRSSSHEYDLLRPFSDAVERVGVIHSVRVTVVEPEDKVLLAVSFDGTWESYIRVLWQKVGTLLDVIFCNTEDYVCAYNNRFEAWEEWARRVQIETHFYYGRPFLTVDDVNYLRWAEANARNGGTSTTVAVRAVQHTLRSAEDKAWAQAAKTSALASLEALKQGLEALAALYRLADLYVPDTDDGWILQRAARDLLLEFRRLWEDKAFPDVVTQAAAMRFDKQLTWAFPEIEPIQNRPRQIPELPAHGAGGPDNLRDVQGGIVHGYPNITHGFLMLLAFDNPAAASKYLAALMPQVTTEHTAAKLPKGWPAINVAVTFEGLRAMGLNEDELALFPLEFRQGMEARASILGDFRHNHPRRWTLPEQNWPKPEKGKPVRRVELSAVHLVVQVRAAGKAVPGDLAATDEKHPLNGHLRRLAGLVPAPVGEAVRMLSVQTMCRHQTQGGKFVEHFGFVDGISQPSIDAPQPGREPMNYTDQVHLGEVLMGYANAADQAPEPDLDSDPLTAQQRLAWVKNGSFLVVRKLRQDVAALNDAVTATQCKSAVRRTILAKMMGREQGGESLINRKLGNDFNYEDDPDGQKCPLYSHIRRANPRRTQPADNESPGRRTPRLVRRGMSYGPKYRAGEKGVKDRGLVFMAYNSSIGEQFEVIQRWLAGGNSTGGYSGHSDPFLGVAQNGHRRSFSFQSGTDETCTVELDGNDDSMGLRRPIVQLEWGAYLFAPSLSALRRLQATAAARAQATQTVWSLTEGRQRIAALRRVESDHGPVAGLQAWKAALEDPTAHEKFVSAAIWAAIRADHGGVLRTPYGVLAAGRERVKEVLEDRFGRYSVSGYQERMRASIGEIYLGRDGGADPKAKAINDSIMKLSAAGSFELARDLTRACLEHFVDGQQRAPSPTDPQQWELTIEIRELVDGMLVGLCQAWFGLPAAAGDIRPGGSRWDWREGEPPPYPGNFTAPSRFIFQPHPGPTAQDYGCLYGRTLTAAFTKFVQGHLASNTRPRLPSGAAIPLVEALFKSGANPHGKPDAHEIAKNMVGVIMGMVPTIAGSLMQVLDEWLRNGTLWSCRTALGAGHVFANYNAAMQALGTPLKQAMQLRPAPELVWRTATRAHSLGDVQVQPGEVVVASLVSATQACLEANDLDVCPVFGGDRLAQPAPPHACPGRDAAMGVLVGFVAALVESRHAMRPSAIPLVLTLNGEMPAPAPTLAPAINKEEAAKSRAALADILSRPPVKQKSLAKPPRAAGLRLDPKLVIGLGDSWFDYFAMDIFDVFKESKYFGENARFFAQAGTSLQQLAANPAQLVRLHDHLHAEVAKGHGVRAILLSAGGNDVVAPTLRTLIKPKSDKTVPMLTPAAQQLVDTKMADALRTVLRNIQGVCSALQLQNVPVVLHAYANPFPDGRGPFGTPFGAWLGPDFAAQGYGDDELELRCQAMAMLLDGLHKMQKRVAAEPEFKGLVTAVDLRSCFAKANSGNYGEYWGNELHPTPRGFRLLAEDLYKAVQGLASKGVSPRSALAARLHA